MTAKQLKWLKYGQYTLVTITTLVFLAYIIAVFITAFQNNETYTPFPNHFAIQADSMASIFLILFIVLGILIF